VTDAAHLRFEMGDVIDSAFTVLRSHFVLFAVTAFIFAGLPAFLQDGLARLNPGSDPRAAEFLYLLVECILQLGLQATLVTRAVATLTGERVDLRTLVGRGVSAMLPLLGLTVVQGLIIFIGLIALVIPGLFLLTIWSVASPVLVMERLSISMAFRRSSALTKGRRWAVLGLVLIYIVLALVIVLVSSAVAFARASGSLPTTVAGALSATLMFMLTTAGVSALYFELRVTETASAPPALLDTFS